MNSFIYVRNSSRRVSNWCFNLYLACIHYFDVGVHCLLRQLHYGMMPTLCTVATGPL